MHAKKKPLKTTRGKKQKPTVSKFLFEVVSTLYCVFDFESLIQVAATCSHTSGSNEIIETHGFLHTVCFFHAQQSTDSSLQIGKAFQLLAVFRKLLAVTSLKLSQKEAITGRLQNGTLFSF